MQEPNSGVIVLAGHHHYYVVPSNGLMYIIFFLLLSPVFSSVPLPQDILHLQCGAGSWKWLLWGCLPGSGAVNFHHVDGR